MMGISLFGTCTMKYNLRIGEALAAWPELAELHPHQDDGGLQGCEHANFNGFMGKIRAPLGDPEVWATTGRAYQRQRSATLV